MTAAGALDPTIMVMPPRDAPGYAATRSRRPANPLRATRGRGRPELLRGQCIVALVKSAEAVSAVGRLIYLPIAVIASVAETGLLGPAIKQAVGWSPIGTTKELLLTAMSPDTITLHTAAALAATLGYGIVFATVGIRQFKWSVN
jgi:ABC-2 type transport system permease protein